MGIFKVDILYQKRKVINKDRVVNYGVIGLLYAYILPFN